jgi:hypothetical protein
MYHSQLMIVPSGSSTELLEDQRNESGDVTQVISETSSNRNTSNQNLLSHVLKLLPFWSSHTHRSQLCAFSDCSVSAIVSSRMKE